MVHMKGMLPRMEARPWRRKPGSFTYRYHPIGGKPINLGTDLNAAIRKVLDLSGRTDDFGTLTHLWRLFQDSQHWKGLSERTRKDYEQASKQLLKVFGAAHVAVITQPKARRYMLVERQGISRANHEIALLSNMLYHAVDLDWIPSNPLATIKYLPQKPRTIVPITAEFDAFATWLTARGKTWRVIGAMARFASRAGSRRTEFRTATAFQVTDKEVRLMRAKQRGEREVVDVIEITPDLRAELESVRREGCSYLFPNRKGNAYTESGFNTMWQKAMRRAIADGIITRRFTFHDLRAHYVTNFKDQEKALPDLHKNPETTARVYDRTVESRRRAL